jgi:hypothetical protein
MGAIGAVLVLGLGLGACTSGDDAADTGTAASPTTVADRGGGDGGGADGGAAAPAPAEGGDGIAPFLRTVPLPCPAELGFIDSRTGESCYQVGDDGGLGTDIIESAGVELAGGYWEVQLVMTGDGIVRFNTLAAGCLAKTTTCPTGRVAFVADGTVVSTTTVIKSDYERDEVMITGRFDAAAARSIAEALDP